ncbi:MAG: hypothetical protein WBA77_05065 [Microcoleaceae cyanobacterium]
MHESRAVELLGEVFRCEPVETEEEYKFTPRFRSSDFTVSISKIDLAATITTLNKKSRHESLWLYDDTTLEILVREESPRPMPRLRSKEINLRDDDNGVSYEIITASDEYILFFLDAISEHSDARLFQRGYSLASVLERRRLAEREEPPTVFELMRMAYLRITTVRIKCNAKTPASSMSSLANAFLFQMAFNTDIALVPQKEIDSIFRSSRISRMRRSRLSEIDPPRRTYTEDLIHHYLMAISTDNPFVEYLSHYHILEHFYEMVFHDDLISSIQHKITDPAFSYRRKKDIQGLIKTISKSLQIKNNTITFSEEQALKLTLIRFVKISDLIDDLSSYDSSIIDYYRDNKVSFANATELDLQSGDNIVIYKSLSKRIYATRNALVHSKDGDKAKYTPFVDDHVLSKELPLLRFVAERTILYHSKMIE